MGRYTALIHAPQVHLLEDNAGLRERTVVLRNCDSGAGGNHRDSCTGDDVGVKPPRRAAVRRRSVTTGRARSADGAGNTRLRGSGRSRCALPRASETCVGRATRTQRGEKAFAQSVVETIAHCQRSRENRHFAIVSSSPPQFRSLGDVDSRRGYVLVEELRAGAVPATSSGQPWPEAATMVAEAVMEQVVQALCRGDPIAEVG